MKQTIISVLFIFAFAAVGFGAVDGSPETTQPEGGQTETRAQLYNVYRQCSDEAGRRAMQRDEVLACSTIYLRLKLSFLDDVSYEDYANLDATERASANRAGYKAYQDWVQLRVIGLN